MPACDVVESALLDVEEYAATDICLQELAKGRLKDAEQHVIKTLAKHQKSLGAPICRVELGQAGQLRSYPFIRPLDVISALDSHGYINACMGAGEASCTTMLSMFWERFAALYPQHDVCADINSGKVDPKYLVPLQMHGDGGRGYRKTEVMILQYQPILGAGTRAAPAEKVDLPLNFLGHSFCTRFCPQLCQRLSSRRTQRYC